MFLLKTLILLHYLVLIWALTLDLDNINLHDCNFDEDDTDTVIHVGLMT